uniref:Uncharacterized protein n=1 Tax=viral metagenome TaxID=1070528 RepID=A0A6C0JMY9_9ZZZZ
MSSAMKNKKAKVLNKGISLNTKETLPGGASSASNVNMKRTANECGTISGGMFGFSLNSSRRVDSHSGETSIQTRFIGETPFGQGQGRSTIVKSQYVNDDPYNTPRPTPKNTQGYLSHKLRGINGVYPLNVVKNKPTTDYATYMAKKHLKKTDSVYPKSRCINSAEVLNNGGKSCSKVVYFSKDTTPMSYDTYLKQNLLINHCIPLPPSKEHYPPWVNKTCTKCTGCSNCTTDITLEEFKAQAEC